MRIAAEKLEKNIAEYVLYMYQIEDTIRSYNLDIDRIENEYLPKFNLSEKELISYRNWYIGLIGQMRSQKIEKTGHLHLVQETMLELVYLHTTLLGQADDLEYKILFEETQEHITEFKDHSNLKQMNPVELSFHALYMKYLLKLQGKEITEETNESFLQITKLIIRLAKSYHKMKRGDLDFLKN